MAKIQSTIDQKTYDTLENLAEKQGCSVSHLVNNIIVSYLSCGGQAASSEIANVQYERLMGLIEQVFFCVYDGEKPSMNTLKGSDEAGRYLDYFMRMLDSKSAEKSSHG